MKNFHLILSALLISTPAFALGLTACDSPDDADLAAEVDRLQAENDALRAAARLSVVAPIDAPALPAAVNFREQGKPWQKYLPTAETQDTIAAIMAACGAKPITISTSGYDPDATTSDDQVLSLAYSYMGGAKARACLDAEMDKRGAVSL